MGTTLMQNKGESREWGEGVFKNSELSAQFFCKTNTALKQKKMSSWEISVSSSQFCYQHKIALKKIKPFKNIKIKYIN